MAAFVKVGSEQMTEVQETAYNALLGQSLMKVRAHFKIQLYSRHTFSGDFKMKNITLVFVILEMIDDPEA